MNMNEKTEAKPALTFVEALKRGLADCDDIDDYIDEWPTGRTSANCTSFSA